MQAQRQATITAQEYLGLERLAPTKSEYYTGDIFAMAGASSRPSIAPCRWPISAIRWSWTLIPSHPCCDSSRNRRRSTKQRHPDMP